MSEVGVEQLEAPKDEPTRTTQERAGPWRITFDTNPDDCNLHCIMCEDHSPYSTTQSDRRKAGRPKRRMGIDLIRRVMEESRGTGLREIIPSTMGEPLLYPALRRDPGPLRGVWSQAQSDDQRDVSQAWSQSVGRANRASHIGREGVMERRDKSDP